MSPNSRKYELQHEISEKCAGIWRNELKKHLLLNIDLLTTNAVIMAVSSFCTDFPDHNTISGVHSRFGIKYESHSINSG